MTTMKTHINTEKLRDLAFAFVIGLVLLAMLAVPALVSAQTRPNAGTLIGNQATATYNDAGGNSRTVTSNVVNTQVEQIAGVTILADLSRTVSPGGQVAYQHTITNTGNGTDVFNLVPGQSGAFVFSSISIYADANGDGVPDDLTPITVTPSIGPGGSFNIVVVVNVPSSATNTSVATLTVTATSAFDNAETDLVTDTATVSTNAVINVTKAMSQATGAAGSGPYTITLTYTNTGNTAATNYVLTDLLEAEFVYVAGTGRWSETGSNALTDDIPTAEPGAGIAFDYNETTASTVRAAITNVGPGQSGTLSFQVTISGTALAGLIPNTAVYNYNDGMGPVGPFNSNTYNFRVLESYDVSGTGETINSASQGATIVFNNVITNEGDAEDVFNVTLISSNFPAGSSIIFYKADGVSPLLDSNNDGIADTGPMAANATYTVKVSVTLPSNATGGGPYTIVKRARSINDPTEFADMNDVLTTIAGNSVDLTADAFLLEFGALGELAGPEVESVKNVAVNPGQTASFTLFVNNTSAVSDNFDLAISTDNTFGTVVLPAGTTARFKNSAGQVIGNTGTILAGGNFQVTLEVTIPTNASATSVATSYFVRAISPASLAADRIHLGVSVNTIRGFTIAPNNSGQIFPGGSVTFTHTITNTGNVTENTGGLLTTTLAYVNNNTGFTTIVYLDTNSDGQIDDGEPVISDAASLGIFTRGQTKQIIVKVSASPGVQEGLNNTTSLTLSIVGTVNGIAAPADVSATDLVTVIGSNVSLAKTQSKDADVDGVADGGDGSFVSGNISAKPGEGIVYRITITNLGTTNITNVNISDAIPNYTVYNTTIRATLVIDGAAALVENTDAEVTFATNTITASIATLAAGKSAVLTFSVTIND